VDIFFGTSLRNVSMFQSMCYLISLFLLHEVGRVCISGWKQDQTGSHALSAKLP
jgi:hypothetical protein